MIGDAEVHISRMSFSSHSDVLVGGKHQDSLET